MKTTQKSLFNLTAEDIMSRDVWTIPQEMSLQAAAQTLAHERISGAPVVDRNGRCVGVLSATDFVRWVEGGGTARPTSLMRSCFCSDWTIVAVDTLPRDEVRWHMSADPITVSPHKRIADVARIMLDAHIHRVIVVDVEQRPMGIVSSTDVLAAVAYAETPQEN